MPASVDPTDPDDATLRVLYDMDFDAPGAMSILDMKINQDVKPISRLVYTMALADDVPQPDYAKNPPSATS